MLRTQFEQDLQKLHSQFYEMGTMVSDAIYKSVKAFVDHDKVLAKEVIDNDHNINEMEIKLEKKSFEMIALQQPVTTDLRMIVTVLKASSDLERLGDQAVAIAKATIRVKGHKRIPEVEAQLSEMSTAVISMVNEVLTAYVKNNERRAREIAEKDEVINRFYDTITHDTIAEMKKNPETIVGGTDYLQVAGFLERIGDYVTNICEWIVYLTTGRIAELTDNNDHKN